MRPMLATAGPLPDGPGWAFEFAWDGARTLAHVGGGELRLVGSERGLAPGYPELDALRDLGRDVVLDGAIVALDAFGRPSRARLARRAAVQQPTPTMLRRMPVAYYVFDVLSVDGASTTELAYEQRRALLAELPLARAGDAVGLAPWFPDTDGRTVLDTAMRYGLHGVVAKRRRSRYEPGRRSRSWVQTTVPRPEQDTEPDATDAPAATATGDAPVTGTRDADTATDTATGPGAQAATPSAVEQPAVEVAASEAGDAAGGAASGELEAELARVTAELRRADAEVDALRARISPHFLYNVLTMITSYVRTDADTARELLGDFAAFTRYAFRTGVTTATIADELDCVERYLALQRERFGSRLRVETQVDPAVLASPAPHLAVQVAVEHAVQDSIERKPGGGTVSIVLTAAGDEWIAVVADDGEPAGIGRGVRSLAERVRDLRVETPAGGGTVVSFRGPLRA